MGWSSGVSLAEQTYDLVREFIPIKKRKKIAREIYELFSDQDADDWDVDDQLIQDSQVYKEWDLDDEDTEED